jgi:hypothetical protein
VLYRSDFEASVEETQGCSRQDETSQTTNPSHKVGVEHRPVLSCDPSEARDVETAVTRKQAPDLLPRKGQTKSSARSSWDFCQVIVVGPGDFVTACLIGRRSRSVLLLYSTEQLTSLIARIIRGGSPEAMMYHLLQHGAEHQMNFSADLADLLSQLRIQVAQPRRKETAAPQPF